MDLQLVGKTALVTGASMGIGRAIAKGLAAEGVEVAAVARRTHLLDELASEIERGQGRRPLLITQDIMAADAATKLRDAALAGLGHVDILVNCAGRQPSAAPRCAGGEVGRKRSRSISPGSARSRMLLLPQMIERRWGRIINITGKSEPDRLNAAFSAKAAIHAWAKGLSRDVGKYGITVNSIPPGTDHERADPPQLPRRVPQEPCRSRDPGRRLWRARGPRCSGRIPRLTLAHYISGAVIPVDGGLRRYAF